MISVAKYLQNHFPSDGMSRLYMKKLNLLDVRLVTKILAQQQIFNYIIQEAIIKSNIWDSNLWQAIISLLQVHLIQAQ